MDVATHALASLTLARAIVPRAPRISWAVAIFAGTVADLDFISAYFGPSAYFAWHRTYLHSIFASLFFAAAISLLYRALAPKPTQERFSFFAAFVTAMLAQWLHLAMDACQWQGVALFWPFSARRLATDWLANVDPWTIVILVVSLALPELLHLVSAEIGARDKKPRGRTAAIVAFAAVFVYIATRATLHSNVVATLEARTYGGETPRRAGAFPETASPFVWHCLVDTESAIHQITASVAPGAPFDPERSVNLFKPEPTPMLDAARNTTTAKRFLSVARFPKATVQKTPTGYEVQFRDLQNAAAGDTQREVVAIVNLDESSKVLSGELRWATQSSQHPVAAAF
jgi:membrane-bound metal-dependent hydrolase YbcI (DUF457 family)